MYVLVNDAFPDVVKVGQTTVNPKHRLSYYQTGDPHRQYKYAALVEVPNAGRAERQIHETLDRFRLRQDGEWFRVPVEVAVRLAESLRKGNSPVTGDQ